MDSVDKIDILEALNKFTTVPYRPASYKLYHIDLYVCSCKETFDKQASLINNQLLIFPRIFTLVDGRTSPGVRRPNRHDLLCAGQQWKSKFLVVYLVG